MAPGDNLTQYHQKSVAAMASLEECHKRLGNDIGVCMAKEPQRAVRFILGLSLDYRQYKKNFVDNLKEWPVSLELAFVDAC